MLQSIKEVKDALQETVMDREYKQGFATLKKTAKKDEGNAVTEIVVNEMFWNCVKDLIALCQPIIELLHLVDGVLPCIAKVYWKMYQIDSFIESSVKKKV